MLRALLKTILIFSVAGVHSICQAELTDEQKKCTEAIDTAYKEVARQRDSQAAAAASNVNTSNTNGQKSQQSGSPIADMMNKINEGNQKKAELIKQQMEQERQINTEQFKQITDIEDKLHDIKKEKSKLPIEIKNAEFARKKQEAEIRMKCQERAQKEYDQMILNNSTLASKSQYAVNSLSQVRGTRDRMTSQRKLFYNRCIADPTTQEALQLAIDELDTKLYNFNIQAGVHNSDLEYTKSKIPKLVAHMDEQRRYVAQSTDIQMNALDQQQQMNQMGMMFAVFSSAMNSNGRQQAAQTFNSADQILNGWENLSRYCANSTTAVFEVPSDMIGIFGSVNRYCKPESVQDPNKACVRSSNRPSVKPTNNSGVSV